MHSINAWLGPFSIEATEAVAVDIILKFLVYLKTIYYEENKFRFLFDISSERILVRHAPAEDYMYGLGTYIHTELKHFLKRLSMSYVLFIV